MSFGKPFSDPVAELYDHAQARVPGFNSASVQRCTTDGQVEVISSFMIEAVLRLYSLDSL